MEFGAVGLVMLAIVLMFYWRMINQRDTGQKSKGEVEETLEKVRIFESLAKDRDALDYLNQQMMKLPDSKQLTDKKKALEKRLATEKK